MVIYLHHPVHGQKVAISEMEAQADEKNGWLRGQPPVALAPKPQAVLTLPRKS